MRSERGYALPVALAALAIGTLLVVPFLGIVSTKSASSQGYSDSVTERYAADAGVEDAIWRLTNGDLASQIPTPGDFTDYSLGEAFNELTVDVGVTRDLVSIANDDFESGGWAGGIGWLQDWEPEGDTFVTSSSLPHDGVYHIQIQGNDGFVKRPVDLSGFYDVRLYFWAKAQSFAGEEQVQCLVSSNGTDWMIVETWANGDDDDVYRFYDVDLSIYELTDQFWIAFQSDLTGADSRLYVDSIRLLRRFPGSTLGTPSDNFESNNWSGGTGWLQDWEHSGRAWVTWLGWPKQGHYHMALMGPSGYVERRADLSNRQNARLQFWVWPTA